MSAASRTARSSSVNASTSASIAAGLAYGAQRLGDGPAHVAVGVGEQRQQGFGDLRITYPAEELHGAQADFEARVAQQAQELGGGSRINAFGEHLGRRQPHARCSGSRNSPSSLGTTSALGSLPRA